MSDAASDIFGRGTRTGFRGAIAARAWWLAPVLVLLAVSTAGLDQGGFRSDTGRYAAVGVQAWREGNLLDLHLQPGVHYYNKPPLALWVHGLVLHVAGVSVWAARLPVVFMAAASVFLVVRTAARLAGPSAGFASGLMLATTYEFFRRTREISLDVWQLAFVMAAVWVVVRASERERGRGLLWAGVPIGLSLMVKPLVGLVALPFMAAWLVWTGRGGKAWWLAGAAVVAMAVAAPWHIAMAMRHGEAFTGRYFGAEVVGRALGEIQDLPPWYYFEIIAKTYWPWLLVIAAAGVHWVRTRRTSTEGLSPLAKLGVIWGLGWLAFVSVFPDKYPRYALPAYAGLAWIGGGYLAMSSPARARRLVRRLPHSTMVTAAVACLMLWLLPIRWQSSHEAGRDELIEWLGSAEPDRVWAWKLSSNDLGDLYLGLGWWPRNSGDGEEGPQPEPELGAMLITRRHFGVMPEPPGSWNRGFLSSDERYLVRIRTSKN